MNDFAEGDTVIPTFMPDCSECVDCKSEKSNLCSSLPFKLSPWMPRDETSRFTDANGEVLYHFLSVSSFSEYTVVDVAHLTKVDPLAPPNKACLLSCGISTGITVKSREMDHSSLNWLSVCHFHMIYILELEGIITIFNHLA